jgi:tRNA dimethylallyltransferase
LKTLIIIAGPTAVGKTALCVQLAKALKCDIFSADSRQFYRELNIGTAKPSSQEMGGVQHHFVNSHSIEEYFSVGDFERDCTARLLDYFKNKPVAILTGGSGMFIRAISHGLDAMPEANLTLRAQLMQQLKTEGLEPLKNQLQLLDPEYYATMDTSNSQRVVRALEVCITAGRPYSFFRQQQVAARPFTMLKICLELDRAQLYQRIDQRMIQMLANGLVDEAKYLLPWRQHNALQTVGYKEVYEFLDGNINYPAMVELLQRNSRRYAKRQITWFKNQDDFTWLPANNPQIVETYVLAQLAAK